MDRRSAGVLERKVQAVHGQSAEGLAHLRRRRHACCARVDVGRHGEAG